MRGKKGTIDVIVLGRDRKWLLIIFKSLSTISWDVFKELAIKRFTDQGYYNVVVEVHELKKIESVEDYHTRFEELRVLEKEPKLTETYLSLASLGDCKVN